MKFGINIHRLTDFPETLSRPLPKGDLERFPTGWNHPIDKKTLKIKKLEHVLRETSDISDVSNIGNVVQLFRNML